VLTRLEAKTLAADGRSAGLNLTRAGLDAATKYPWPKREGIAKYGVYAEDLEVFGWMREGAPGDRRCLEAQIMDWADDVAYSVHDLEDGIHAGLLALERLDSESERKELVALAREAYLDVSEAELLAALDRLREHTCWVRGYDGSMAAMVAVKRMTSELIGRFCGAATRATHAEWGGVPLRRYGGSLEIPDETRAECAVLKAVAAKYVMRRDETLALQERQREQLSELLAAIAAGAPDTLERPLRASFEAASDDAAKLRVVVDQVASLTDTSALVWHQRLVS
jgi:dGTPase